MSLDAPDPRLIALGSSLRRIRRERNMSQEETARRAGVHPNHVGRIERGSKDVRVTTLLSLLSALEVSPAELGLLELADRPPAHPRAERWRPTSAGEEQRRDLVNRIDGAQRLLSELRRAVETERSQ